MSIVAGTSQLVAAQQPSSVVWSQAQNTIKLTPRTPPGAGSGSVLSSTAPGTRVCRLRITNTVAFTANSQANLAFNFTISPYPTKVFQYIGVTNTELTCTTLNSFSNANNIVLNASATPPTAYAVTGGGSYCQGGSGLPVGVANSQIGVTYTLLKGGVSQVPTVAGTGSAIAFGNQLSGTYTVSGTSSSGTTPMSGSAVITETATVAASVTIVANANNVNAGTLVTFTATPVGGGDTPTYQWFKNAVAVATGAVYSYVPVNNDLVYAVMTSNSPCASGSPATSNSITMVVITVISNFNLTLANDTQTAPNIMEFDVYLLDSDASSPFEMAAVKAGIVVNPGIYNGGTVSLSIVPSSSQLLAAQQPNSVIWSQAQNTIKLTPRTPPGAGSGSILSTTAPGTRVCRLRITNTVAFTANSTANLTFNFTISPYPTKVFQYLSGLNTELTCTTLNSFSNAANIILNPASAPTAFAVTGSGVYCQSTGGLPVGLANSETGVTYTLFKDAVAQAPTVAGTGSAITFGNQLAGTYTVSGTNGGGTTAMTGSAVITETPSVAASVTIAADANNVCAGTSVTFTASPVGGGATPTYQWYKNTLAVATGSTYSYVALNGDVVYVVMTSNAPCATGSPATSNSVTMAVTAQLATSVTITASANPVTTGTTVTFTPTPVNGGTPTYQWHVNGSQAATGSPYAYVPVNGDQVYVIMTTSLSCVTSATATSNTITVTVNASVPATSTWTGNIDSDWFKSGNWSDGIPGAITLVTIPGGLTNYPTLLSSTGIAGITINNGGSFIGSEYLTTGTALVKRDIVNTNYHYVSSPVASTTFGSVFPLNQFEVWAREYNETTGDWDNLAMADYLAVGKGYSVQMNQPQTALFSGVLNSSPVTSTLSKQNPGVDPNRVGWNLLGNPFSSAIDWDLTSHSAIDASVYVWNGVQYVSWNGTTGALTDGIIPAENGFFAKTAVNGATLSIPLASRVHSAVGFYKSALADLLELTAEGNSNTDKTYVHFNDQASAAFDNQYDAYKIFGNDNAPQLFSMITGDVLSINELPMAGNEVVDLGFKCNTTGIYTVSASGTDNFSSAVPVFLQDVKLDITQDLKINPVYSFSYVAGEPENRFRLLFLDVTGIDEPTTAVIRVFSFDKTVVIENADLLTGTIGIYDITGRELYTQKLTGQVSTYIPLQVVTGTYVVKVISAKAAVNTKVHIR
jgi:hypothetical protein